MKVTNTCRNCPKPLSNFTFSSGGVECKAAGVVINDWDRRECEKKQITKEKCDERV